MNKDECISKFVAYLIIAFPFMAMFAFLVELFTIEIFIEISKNHGSLIAGVIGFIGIFILISNQNKTTREMIENQNQTTKETLESNMLIMRSEAFEIRKSQVLEYAFIIQGSINASTDQRELAGGQRVNIRFFDNIQVEISHVQYFFNSRSALGWGYIEVIKDYIILYQNQNNDDLSIERTNLVISMQFAHQRFLTKQYNKLIVFPIALENFQVTTPQMLTQEILMSMNNDVFLEYAREYLKANLLKWLIYEIDNLSIDSNDSLPFII